MTLSPDQFSKARARSIGNYPSDYLSARHSHLASLRDQGLDNDGFAYASRANFVQQVIEKANVRNELVRRGVAIPDHELNDYERQNLGALSEQGVHRRG